MTDPFAVDGAPLAVWGVAEVAVTIMAACIPVMRVLFRDVATQARSYRDKWTGYGSGDRSADRSGGRSAMRSGTGGKLSVFGKTQNSTVISSIGPPVPPKESSEKSFLDTSSGEPSPALGHAEQPQGRRILQTNEISVKWSRPGKKQDQLDYELSAV